MKHQKLIRKQIYIEPTQEAWLKRLSRDMGISEAELIRQSLGSGAAWAPAGDLAAWETERDFLMQRLNMAVSSPGRTWSREDLYQDRLERYGKRQDTP